MTQEEFIILFEQYLEGTLSEPDMVAILGKDIDFELKDYPWKSKIMGTRQEVRDKIIQSITKKIKIKRIKKSD
ncbi:hypothetical protein [Pedobacter sp.]|uniref:hypothetical protein n=1 Tax=Pedobacter sp. TaxID=1411316 RepID=UPI003BAA2279